jgi:hypothetical protein
LMWKTDLWLLLIVRAPMTSWPSSVRVPVLSKQITSNLPPTFTLLYEIISDNKTLYVGIYTLVRAYAEDALLLETRQCKIGANGESCWQSRWDDYRD